MADGNGSVGGRRAGRFDVEFFVLCAVARGADYGYLAMKHVRKVSGLELPPRSIYRLLRELAVDGCLTAALDGDLKTPPDEWIRRVYSLTDAGSKRLEWLEGVYGSFLGDRRLEPAALGFGKEAAPV